MAETALLHALTRGRVQGVGFRFFVQDRAEAHGLTGYVRNLREGGAVEVVAEGPRESLEVLLSALWKGPGGSFVNDVEVHWGQASGQFSGFEVRY